MTPVWAALTADKGDKGAEPVTEVIQRGIKQRLLKYLARVSRENRTPLLSVSACSPPYRCGNSLLRAALTQCALTATSTVANLFATAPA